MPADSGGVDITNGTLATGAATVTFAARYGHVEFKNLDTAAMYVTTDGSSPVSSGGSDQFAVGPGERVLLPNRAPLWWQGSGTPNPGTTVKIAGSASGPFSVMGV